jgi:hypothetical protein
VASKNSPRQFLSLANCYSIKCVGGNPCERCEQHGEVCQYKDQSGPNGLISENRPPQYHALGRRKIAPNPKALVALEGSKGPMPFVDMTSPKATAPSWSTEMMRRYGPQETISPLFGQGPLDRQAGSPNSQRSSKQGGGAYVTQREQGENVETRGEIRWLQDPNGRLCELLCIVQPRFTRSDHGQFHSIHGRSEFVVVSPSCPD